MVVSSVLSQFGRSIWLANLTKAEIRTEFERLEAPGVTELTSDNFNNLVTKGSRDALIFFYKPTCRHCLAFKPTWIELANKLKNENLDIFTMDASSNKWPRSEYPVNKYPTVYFKFASKKSADLYSGDRKLTDLMRFVASRTKLINYDGTGNPLSEKRK